MTASANARGGTYAVLAGGNGITNTASFTLTNFSPIASPTITTTPSVTSVTLGALPVTLDDTAQLVGGNDETGTITFTLYLGSTVVNTESVSVNGDGSYPTPVGYTLPATGAVVGTYQWDASYSGDAYNYPCSETDVAAEQVTVNPASPTIATTPSPTAVTLGPSPVTLNDTAVLSGGYDETGTITFTLYQGSTAVDTETVSVNGNGSYTTPSGYTLPTTGTVIGTYQWDASYTGDANNNPYGENNAAAEQVTVSPASPTITTTPNVTAVALDTSPATLKDTAVLAGGDAETGTITFTLYVGSTELDSETVPVNGNGSYTTPSGYTLPSSGAAIGTYQWDASYTGDANNNPFSENNAAAEQVTVRPASPTITTTPSATSVTLGTSAVTLKDTAALCEGDAETGTITFTLYLGSTEVDSETVSVNGNGNYTTPTGYTLPTTGTVTGTYQWDASYSGDADNNPYSENNSAAEQVIVNPASPTITTTPSVTSVTLGTSRVTLKDTAVLAGGDAETGTLTFTLYLGSTAVNSETVSVNGNGNYTTPTGYSLPTTGTVTGTYQWDASYSGDGNNNAYSENNATAEQVTVSPADPAITTTPSVTSVTLGTTAVNLKDTAVLAGGDAETGTIMFTLYLGSTEVNSETVSVSGNGSYTTPTGYTLPTTGTVTGTYQWDASYSGDGNNNPYSENNAAAEQVTVSPIDPTITTTPSPTVVPIGTTASLTDTATLAGGVNPTGTITFTLYQGSTKLDSQTVTVSGDGTYTTPAYSLSSSASAGIYQWDATYSGDGNNDPASDNNDPAEQVTVVDSCCNLQDISYSVYNPATKATTTPSDLSGNTQQGDTVTVTFTVPSGDYDEISLVSYNAPEPFYDADDANLQTVFQSVTAVEAPGTHTLSVTLPNNFYQVDFVCGTVITTLGPESTNPNNFYHAQNRYIDGDNNGSNPQGSGILSLTGTVYNDVGEHGKLESGDPTVGNVTVTLSGTDAYGNSISETATSNSSGVYTFSGLPFSSTAGYSISVAPPAGYADGTATAGTVSGATDGTATISPEGVSGIVLASSTQTTGTGYNLGLLTSADLTCGNPSVVVLSSCGSGTLTVFRKRQAHGTGCDRG